MSKGDVVVDTGARFASRAGSIPGGNVLFFFWNVRLLFNYDNQNYSTSDMSKCGVLVKTVTWILSRAGSIPGVGNVRFFFEEYDFFFVKCCVSFLTNTILYLSSQTNCIIQEEWVNDEE